MYNPLDTKILIPFPKAILDKLDKKTREKLEKAIESHSEPGFVRYTQEIIDQNFTYAGEMGQCIVKDAMLVELKSRDYETISDICRLSIERKSNIEQNKKAEAAIKELAEIKQHVKLIKDFVDA